MDADRAVISAELQQELARHKDEQRSEALDRELAAIKRRQRIMDMMKQTGIFVPAYSNDQGMAQEPDPSVLINKLFPQRSLQDDPSIQQPLGFKYKG
jgi:hypothetical protein